MLGAPDEDCSLPAAFDFRSSCADYQDLLKASLCVLKNHTDYAVAAMCERGLRPAPIR